MLHEVSAAMMFSVTGLLNVEEFDTSMI